ncbi:MAG: L-histidine N(alpha)-methyltransferase, partial [Nitrosopumilus sp.]
DIFAKIHNKIEYFPIDISEILTESSELLQRDYPDLKITGIIDTYEGGLEFIEKYDDKKNLIIFLGSSFGNFTPDEGKTFLQKINSIMKNEDLFLIGLDLVKNKKILEDAYDDSQGITAKFNLNVLSRINDELDADFVLNDFEHVAKYNEKDQRVEMYLKSLVNQSVIISKANFSLKLKQGELIHTEYSHKYKISQIKKLMDDTGFVIKQNWVDENNQYTLTLVSKK